MGLFGWDDASSANDQVYNQENNGSWTHELIAAAAGYEAMKSYNNYEAENGKPQSNQMLKEVLAGFAAAEVDKLAETKGLDWLDREKAKKMAAEQSNTLFSQNGTGWPEGEPEQQQSSWW